MRALNNVSGKARSAGFQPAQPTSAPRAQKSTGRQLAHHLPIAALLLLTLIGCDQLQPSQPAARPQPVIHLIDDLLRNHDGELAYENWYVHKIEGAKIGHRWSRAFNLQIGSRQLVRTLTIDELRIPRFGRTVDQSIRATTLETPDGQVLQLAYEMKSGKSKRSYHATVAGDLLHWETQDSKRRKGTIPWDSDIGGYQFIEKRLQQNQVDHPQKIAVMMPLFIDPIHYRFTKTSANMLALYSGNEPTPASTIETDDSGMVKQTFRFLGRELVRATELAAMSPNDRLDFDIAFAISVPVTDATAKSLATPQPERTFRVTLKDQNPAYLIPSSGGQTITPIDQHTALITVTKIGGTKISGTALAAVPQPTQPTPSPTNPTSTPITNQTQPPTSNDVQPNRWLESNHRFVLSFVRDANIRSSNVTAVAESLRQHVHRSMTATDLGTSLATAAQVANSRSGDCTEHAMLLAASCRASKIPARVAVGLIYDPNRSAFVYHMWTEFWSGKNWQPLDAIVPETTNTRIKLSHTNLNGESDYSIVAPVIRLAGQLTIDLP